jgi:valyl-tRNA synthetase
MPAGEWRELVVAAADDRAADVLRAGGRYLEALARGRPVRILPPGTDGERPATLTASPLGPAWFLAGEGEAAQEAAAERRSPQRERLLEGISRLRDLLANEGFVSRAPAEVVQRERDRLADLEAQLRQLEA